MSDALRVIGEAHSILGARQIPYRERGLEDTFKLEFIPMAEVLMTKAFVLSKMKWHKDAIEASDNAEKVSTPMFFGSGLTETSLLNLEGQGLLRSRSHRTGQKEIALEE